MHESYVTRRLPIQHLPSVYPCEYSIQFCNPHVPILHLILTVTIFSIYHFCCFLLFPRWLFVELHVWLFKLDQWGYFQTFTEREITLQRSVPCFKRILFFYLKDEESNINIPLRCGHSIVLISFNMFSIHVKNAVPKVRNSFFFNLVINIVSDLCHPVSIWKVQSEWVIRLVCSWLFQSEVFLFLFSQAWFIFVFNSLILFAVFLWYFILQF